MSTDVQLTYKTSSVSLFKMLTKISAVLLFILVVEARTYKVDSGYDDSDTPIYYPNSVDDDLHYYPDFIEFAQRTKGRYPIFSRIPITQFSCRDFPFPGYFADVITGCQVYHICESNGRRSSFLCPNQTIFNQQTLVCDWWYNVDCKLSNDLYYLNDFKFSPAYRRPSQRQPDYQSPHDQSFNSINYGSRLNTEYAGGPQGRQQPEVNRYHQPPNNYDFNQYADKPTHNDYGQSRPEYSGGHSPQNNQDNYGHRTNEGSYNAGHTQVDGRYDNGNNAYGGDSRGYQSQIRYRVEPRTLQHKYETLQYDASNQTVVVDTKKYQPDAVKDAKPTALKVSAIKTTKYAKI